MDPRTSGASVYENNETSIPGIFACGNVLHVHDLVDFVTVESQRAGKAAAIYAARNTEASPERTLTIRNGNGVTYTVPQRIRPAQVPKAVDVFFRVNHVYSNQQIVVSSGDNVCCKWERAHLAPGEMEHIVIPCEVLKDARDSIVISLADAEEKEITA